VHASNYQDELKLHRGSWEEGERKGYRAGKRIDICYMYTYETHQTMERGRGNWNIMEGKDLFHVQCMHVWNYHNETPSLMHANSKLKLKRIVRRLLHSNSISIYGL
jgi:hypothetical protein